MAAGRGGEAQVGGQAADTFPVVGARPTLLERPRLLEAALGEAAPRVTLLIAPSGYGKSVLLAQAAAQAPTHVALDLRETGGQIGALSQALIGGVEALGSGVADALRRAHGEDRLTPGRTAELLASLPPTLLTVDHAERLGPDGEGWLLGLVRQLPAPHRLMVAARTLASPEVPYLVATGTAALLGPEQLAFDAGELAELGLSPGEHPGGWPLGAALGRAGAPGQVGELLLALVDALPEPLRGLLPLLAPYPVWTPHLPATLRLELPPGWLTALVRERLPVLALPGGRFQPHEALLGVLDGLLRMRPAQWQESYREAARRARAQGHDLQAIALLRHAELEEEAAALAEDVLPALAARGQFLTVREVTEGLPERVRHASPVLRLQHGLALLETGQVRAGQTELRALAEQPGERWRALILLGHAAFLTARLEEARQLTEEALGFEDRYTPTQRVTLVRMHGNLLRELGSPEEALERLLGALRLAQGHGLHSSEAHTLLALNVTYLRLSRVDEALEAVTRAAAIYEELGQTERLPVPLLNTAVLLRARGETARARELLSRALAIAEDGRARTVTGLHYVLGDVLRAEGDLVGAGRHAREAAGRARASACPDQQLLAELLLSELLRQEERGPEADRQVAAARHLFELHPELAQSGLLVDLFNFHEGQVALAAGDLRGAEEAFARVPGNVGELRQFRARAALCLAEIARRRGTLTRAQVDAFMAGADEPGGALHFPFDLPETRPTLQEAVRRGWYTRELRPWAEAEPGERRPRLRIRTLGDLEVTLDGRALPLTGSSPTRARELLALLALTPGLTSRDLQRALIGDGGRGDHRNALTTARRSLTAATGLSEPIAQDSQKRYRFAPALDVQTDVHLLREAACGGDVPALRELLCGDPEFLPGLDSPWAADLRETELPHDLADAYSLLGRDALGRRDYPEALRLSRLSLALRPGDLSAERTVRELERAMQVPSAVESGG